MIVEALSLLAGAGIGWLCRPTEKIVFYDPAKINPSELPKLRNISYVAVKCYGSVGVGAAIHEIRSR